MFWFLNRAHYSGVMPHQLEALQMVDMVKADKKGILSALVLISLVAIPFFFGCFWMFVIKQEWISESIGSVGKLIIGLGPG